MENAIECRGVVKRYSYSDVLRGLDLIVPHGAVMGLVGANGAGKTTLMKCLLGMVRVRSGSVEVLGRNAAELDEATKARIGYVPQVNALYPWMTAKNIADYVGSFYPHWDEKLVYGLIESWGVSYYRKIRELSVGQAQKLAIILALGHKPDLLILDEPAASLDPGARRDFLRAILNLIAEHSPTVLFSTHITSDIERIADQVAIMKDGAMTYCGDLGALKDSVKKVRLTGAALPSRFLRSDILRQEVHGNEAMLTVRNFSREWLERATNEYQARAEVFDMNLEDIFLGLNTDRSPS